MTYISDRPCPIRQTEGRWEVGGFDDADIERWIECESEGHAQAVADCRVILELRRRGQPCDPDRVQRCLGGLALAGLGTSLVYRRVLACVDKPD